MMPRERFGEGKVPRRVLASLISRLTRPGREVLVGPAVGEDAFAVSAGRSVLIGTTDPITFTGDHIGYYAVNVNANDVATMGGRPRWFLATVLVPRGFQASALRRIFDEIDRACVELGARLLGGHTEVSSAVSRPVVVGAMMGLVAGTGLVRAGRARAGDILLLTKRLAIEGTSIIARERRREVEALLGKAAAARARNLIFEPGISVVREALAAAAAGARAMHDPTEGGLAWGLRELATAAGHGMVVDFDAIPVFDETARICGRFGIDPLGLISSGSLAIAVAPSRALIVEQKVKSLGVECARIGRLGGRSVRMKRQGRPARFPDFEADEIGKALATAERA
jgi:hydrogenase expression/formation protein HypE